jgi:hypothetical protein
MEGMPGMGDGHGKGAWWHGGDKMHKKSASLQPMVPPPLDPEGPSTNDKRLWIGLIGLFSSIFLLAFAIHKFLPASSNGTQQGSGNSNAGKGSPLMTRQQLLENQQAMPELADFDSQTPPQIPINGGGPVGPSSPPSRLGSGVLGH